MRTPSPAISIASLTPSAFSSSFQFIPEYGRSYNTRGDVYILPADNEEFERLGMSRFSRVLSRVLNLPKICSTALLNSCKEGTTVGLFKTFSRGAVGKNDGRLSLTLGMFIRSRVHGASQTDIPLLHRCGTGLW